MDPATQTLLERYFLLDTLPLCVTLAADQRPGESDLSSQQATGHHH
jgi:hypothetical protein